MTSNAAPRKPEISDLLAVEAANDVFHCSPDDPTAAMAFVRQIAASIARRMPEHVDRDELVGLGTLGWAEARARFDPSRGVPFAGFAASRIRGAILDGLRRADTLSRADRRRAQQSSEPTLPRIVCDPVEYDAAVDRSADEGDVSDLLARRELCDELRVAMQQLPERDRHVLSRHFFDDVPMRAIGAELGVTESRISQIVSAALVRLRSAFGIVRLPASKSRRAANARRSVAPAQTGLAEAA
jgi:RNA polymerase sigma factor for flagellar operon FliA